MPPEPSTKSSRKRQSRLGFVPVPSSSPAAKDYHPQIRDRAATMSIDRSPSSIKRRVLLSPDSVNTFPALVATAGGVRGEEDSNRDSNSESAKRIQRRMEKRQRKSKAKQQRLDFTTARDANTFDAPVTLASSSAHTRSSRGTGMFSSQAQGAMIELSSDDDLPSPAKRKPKTRASDRRTETDKNGNRKRRPSKTDAGDSEQDQELPISSLSETQELSDSEDDDVPRLRRRKQSSLEKTKTRVTRSSQRPIEVDSDSEGVRMRSSQRQTSGDEDDDEDDDMPTTAGTQRRRRNREQSNNSFLNDSPSEVINTEDDHDVAESRKSSKKRSRQETGSEEEEESDGPAQPKTPQRRRPKKSRKTSRQEQSDLADDLAFLGPSSDVESSARPPRSTASVKKSARELALQKLKNKRSAPLEQVDEMRGGEQEISDDHTEEDEDDVPQFISSSRMFAADEEDEGFLDQDEDEDGILGLPENVPIEFSRYASMKPKQLFEFSVAWMVQKRINPAFQYDDPLYELTFRKLNDEVRGLAGSKFTSSAWTADFNTALQARPEMMWNEMSKTAGDVFLRDKCDACNRSGHPATWEVQFQGKPYEQSTLEEIDNDVDDDDDDNDESVSDQVEYNSAGREVPPADFTFYVGRFCFANAQTAHALSHWKWHMYQYVDTWLISQGYMAADKVVERDKWKTKKRGKYAHKIVDHMKEIGQVKELWTLFKRSAEDARNSKQGRSTVAVSP